MSSVYLATDERNEENLEWLRKNRATLFSDLIAPVDREQFGWPLLFTDIIGLVEQQSESLCPRIVGELTRGWLVIGYGSSYFYAHGMSSVCAFLNTEIRNADLSGSLPEE